MIAKNGLREVQKALIPVLAGLWKLCREARVRCSERKTVRVHVFTLILRICLLPAVRARCVTPPCCRSFTSLHAQFPAPSTVNDERQRRRATSLRSQIGEKVA